MTTPPSIAVRPLVLLGAGGHAKVLLSLVRAAGHAVLGVCDPALAREGVSSWRGVAVLGGDEALDRCSPDQVDLVNGIGQLVGGAAREKVFEAQVSRGFRFPALVHPSAWVDSSAVLDAGVQVMAGAVVQADARIGDNSIVNTGARVDHDCVIGPHVHLAPGATLCGTVHVGARGFVGAGATIIQGIRIGDGAVVGAGSAVVRDVSSGQRWLGNPAQPSA